MASIKRNNGNFSIVERYKDDQGTWRTKTLCHLACYPSVEAALVGMPADLAELDAELAKLDEILSRNRFYRFAINERERLLALRERWRAQLDEVLAYATTLTQEPTP